MQYGAAWTIGSSYDANGNLTSDGSTSFTYDMENRLVAASGAKGANLRYDPLGRLYEVNGPFGLTRFIYDGDHVAAEYNSAGTVLRRYMWGPGHDEPILWDEGSAVNCSGGKFLHPDRQGSVVAAADCAGALIGINKYDEYGIPQSGNTGRFQYTGQAWLPELGMYYYKARIYSPTLGRFLQTDPIGYGDGLNWYAYVGSDPVNFSDPSGTEACIDPTDGMEVICVTASNKAPRMPGEGAGGATQPRVSIGRGAVPKPKPKPEPKSCPAKSQNAQMADISDDVALASQAAAVVSIGAGLVTAETGAGPPAAGVAARGFQALSTFASLVSFRYRVADGDYKGAGLSLLSAVGGTAAGRAVGGALGRSYANGRTFRTLTADQARRVGFAEGLTQTSYDVAFPDSKDGC